MDAKIVAAITAAVTQYLQQEQQSGVRVNSPAIAPRPAANLWGLAGREDAMRLRHLWQLGMGRKSA